MYFLHAFPNSIVNERDAERQGEEEMTRSGEETEEGKGEPAKRYNSGKAGGQDF